MHLLITADAVGGVWTYTSELVAGLVRRGVRVTLVSFGPYPAPHQTEWLKGLPGVDFRPTCFRLEWMQHSSQDIAEARRFLRYLVSEVEPDLLHSNQYAFGDLDCAVPRVVVAHSDVVSWWVAVHGEEPPDSRWIGWYRDTLVRGLRAASAVIAPSQWMLDQVGRYYTRPWRGEVIYNGRSPDAFDPDCAKPTFVLSAGRLWDRAKQVSILADADLDLPVVIAGAEEHPQEHSGDASRLTPMRGRVGLLGQLSQSQLRRLYASAGIYAATSCYEPFGLAPLEAALSGCALVANDIPSFREVWDDAACYYRRGDPASLASEIRALAANSSARHAFGRAAFRRAREKFTAERMCDRYMQLYSTLVRKPVAAEARA